MYDKYKCDTTALPTDTSENQPLFFTNPETGTNYDFFPDLVALESNTMVTDVQKMTNTTGEFLKFSKKNHFLFSKF